MLLQRMMRLLVASLSISSLVLAGCSRQPDSGLRAQEPAMNVQTQLREPDVVYVPTPQEVVMEMLKLAKVTRNDVVYDLGSGDGRIPIAAAREFGARGVGIDIDPERIQEANQNAREAGVTDRVRFFHQDMFTTDLSNATVVTLYLLPSLNEKLRPKLLSELRPGTRIVSHSFDMGNWKPEKRVQVNGPNGRHTLYLWTVPSHSE